MKPKILMLGWEFPPFSWGGLGTACSGLIKGLLQNNVQVKLLLPYENVSNLNFYDNSKKACLKKKIYNYLYTNMHKKIISYAKMSLKKSKENEFDLVHAHDWMTFKAAVKIKKITKKPLIIHIHSTEFERKKKEYVKKDIYNIEKIGMENADLIISVSSFLKKRISKNYGINPKKIHVVHNAVSLDAKNCLEQIVNFGSTQLISKFKKLNKIFLNKEQKIVLFLGRLTFQKGPEYFIKAAKIVLQKTKDVHFVIAGDGDLKGKLIKLVNFLDLKKNFTFTGFLNKDYVNYIYEISDVYVMPSIYEPFGIAPLEAMYNNLPVIISHNAGACEIIKNCIKVDYSNENEIASRIIQLLYNQDLYNNLCLKGKKEVESISWKKSAEKVLQIYKRLFIL